MVKNTIKFNCKNYKRDRVVFPECCLNCAIRSGYPINLGGDQNCKNYNNWPPQKTGGNL
jgi:hypothetical protein